MSFETAYAAMAEFEGVYSNNPKDPGGETYAGTSRVYHPKWPGWPLIDFYKPIKAISPANKAALKPYVLAFYRSEFWEPLRCPEIDVMPAGRPIAGELFEAGVNCGQGNGVKFLQRALNRLNGRAGYWPELLVDGLIGAKTLAAVKACLGRGGNYPNLLLRCQNGEQYIHYVNWPKHQDFPGVFARTRGEE